MIDYINMPEEGTEPVYFLAPEDCEMQVRITCYIADCKTGSGETQAIKTA